MDILEAMHNITEGNKVCCDDWDVNEYIYFDISERELFNENKEIVCAYTLLANIDSFWNIWKGAL